MSIFTYTAAGRREPFDPSRLGAHLDGCLLCGRRVRMVGIFLPSSEPMRSAVLQLREHPLDGDMVPGLAYGLCRRHAADLNIDHVEAAIRGAARKVTVQ